MGTRKEKKAHGIVVLEFVEGNGAPFVGNDGACVSFDNGLHVRAVGEGDGAFVAAERLADPQI